MTSKNINYSERILGALWGSLAGDALGVPVEFQTRETVRENPVTGMRGFGTHRQPAGTWSDDSSLLLCTAESLVHAGGLDTADLGARFVRWERDGCWTPHGEVFDIGHTTARAISQIASGTPPEEAGGADTNSNGNGSLMRIIPIALWFHEESEEAIAAYALRASSLTHRHARSQMASAYYCLLARELLHGASRRDALRAAFGAFSRIYARTPFAEEMPHFRLLDSEVLDKLPETEIASSGYVIHTLLASVWCLLTSESFEETLLKAVNLGEDTDTTGTVAGGLAGAYYGMKAIPFPWEQLLARHDDVESLFASFLSSVPEHRAGPKS
jgi:ADP-ribosyl-[dinitrogen reductase] hydrolase